MAGDLAGLLVISIEQAVAAPYLSARLAEAGARVIKIEREEGDFARRYDQTVHGQSAYFVWLNRGKESVCLDLRAPEDRALLEAMLARADIFIQNLAPGAIDRLGFAQARLRAAYPGLITAWISGYGDEGPYRELKAYDLLVQAEVGLSAITGNAAGPARVGVSVADIACGMTAHQAVLQALIGRQATGRGRHVAVSLFHALADWMNVPYLQHVYGGVTPGHAGLSHPTIAPYGVFQAADGGSVLLSIQNEREWQRFCAEILDQADLAEDARFATNSDRVRHRETLDAIVRGAFLRLPAEALLDRLRGAGIACGRVSSLDDLARHPQLRLTQADTPGGRVELLAPGALMDGESPRFGPVPALGADSARVRAEFAPNGAKTEG
mgnify:CR=1 FL=1